MKSIRIVIVDDHAVVRQGLKTFLDLQDDIEVVGEGKNGLEAIELVDKLEPDVILLDLIMPELDGIEATIAIREKHPDAKIAILSSFSDEEKVMPALEAGVVGYLLKDIAPDELADSVRAIHAGETRLHPQITKQIMSRIQVPKKSKEEAREAENLTNREIDVLKLLARGMSNDEISVELSISTLTVKTHVSNILGKLDLADRTQAALYAVRHGIAPLDPP